MDDIDRLFREYHAPIVRYLTRQLNDADLAEELAQETFLRALRHEPVTNERAWLFAVASNLVRDLVRREGRQRKHLELLQAEEREREADNQREPEELTPEALREASLAREALHTIPERDRMALFMSQEGLNYHEIAAALGLSVQSVGTTLTRARKKVVQNYETLARERDGNGGTHVAS
jgi:RNA polymerase sigma-70 factor (ECF subfamily)